MSKEELAAVTGGTGFIGRALTKRLLAEGFRVRVLSRGVPSDPLPGAEYFQVDFSDPASLTNALEGADRVVHMAAALFCRSKEEFERANTVGTANMVTAVNSLASRPKRFVYISSLAAAGPSPTRRSPGLAASQSGRSRSTASPNWEGKKPWPPWPRRSNGSRCAPR